MATTVLRCHQCGQTDTFHVTLTAVATAAGDGTVTGYVREPDWDSNAHVVCPACTVDGNARDFTA